jgi:hypothetical protein
MANDSTTEKKGALDASKKKGNSRLIITAGKYSFIESGLADEMLVVVVQFDNRPFQCFQLRMLFAHQSKESFL